MTDREILIWFHQRLVFKYKEREATDYMHRLRWIIHAMPHKKISRGNKVQVDCNSAKGLLTVLKHPTEWEARELSEE